MLIERPLTVVTGLPAAGKTTLLGRWGGDYVDLARLLRELLMDAPVWRRAREALTAMVGEDVADHWPSPGLDALRLPSTATRAASVERLLTRFAIEHLRATRRSRDPLLIEATPVAAASILKACVPAELVIVSVDETIRLGRIAARLDADRRTEAGSIARFQRVAHRAALAELRASPSYGWSVSERSGDQR